ncbi:MAG: hypothetical protein ABJF04_18295 [Reichenbachiella sp.]|uniref:hypothetical protein n=1 Tax=Reichenbachiella sp. TaxID=2184521 RepID=UPI003263D608
MKQIIYLSLILVWASCEKKAMPLDKEKVTQEVEQMLADYHDDIAESGLTAEFKYLDQSDDFFWVPPGYNSALNYDSVKTILEKNALAFQSISFQWDTLRIFPLSYEIVNYTGIVVGQMVDTSGVASKVSIIESGTLIRRKSGWKLLSGQSAVLDTDSEGS